MRKFAVSLLFILFFVSMLGAAFGIKAVKAVTITVPDDYNTIQAAINHANKGDTIFVRNGEYHENVVVNKTLSMVGENVNTTIIIGSGAGQSTVQVTGSKVAVSGFTIQNGGYGYGLSGPLSGIQLYQSRGDNISGNILKNNYVGICLSHSGNNTLTANKAYDNCFNFAAVGSSSLEFYNHIDTSNTFDGKSIYYLTRESNLNLGAQSDAGVIYLIDCKNITIQDLSLSRNYWSVYLWNTTESLVANITAQLNCGAGIRLERSNNNTIANSRLWVRSGAGFNLSLPTTT